MGPGKHMFSLGKTKIFNHFWLKNWYRNCKNLCFYKVSAILKPLFLWKIIENLVFPKENQCFPDPKTTKPYKNCSFGKKNTKNTNFTNFTNFTSFSEPFPASEPALGYGTRGRGRLVGPSIGRSSGLAVGLAIGRSVAVLIGRSVGSSVRQSDLFSCLRFGNCSRVLAQVIL